MFNDYYTETLLNMKGLIVENIKTDSSATSIFFSLKRKPHNCPSCHKVTNKVHDYRTQVIKDLPILGKRTLLFYRKRRYLCPSCHKRFYESNTFLPKYYRCTSRFIKELLYKFSDNRSITSIAKEYTISPTTAFRFLSFINYPKPHSLPSVLSIDEFRGNAGRKFQCIITNPKNKKVLDIIKGRESYILTDYFRTIPNRDNVRYFVMDMYYPYLELARSFFKNATVVIDKFHFVRHVIWAFDRVRRSVQKNFSSYRRKYFKRSKTLLTRRRSKLTEEQIDQVNVMLDASPRLATAYMLKEKFLEFVDSTDYSQARKSLNAWYLFLATTDEPEFTPCEHTIRNWEPYILNSFTCTYTNGFTEGYNNKIKVLKRNSYGVRNFERFRNRILHMS